jgi:hypothetical protein
MVNIINKMSIIVVVILKDIQSLNKTIFAYPNNLSSIKL